MLDIFWGIIIGIVIGLHIGEYQACPKDKYSLEYGCVK